MNRQVKQTITQESTSGQYIFGKDVKHNPLFGTHEMRIKSVDKREIFIPISIAPIFTAAKIQNQPKHSSIDSEIYKSDVYKHSGVLFNLQNESKRVIY